MLLKTFLSLFLFLPFLAAQQDSVRSYALPPVYISATKTALSPLQVSSTISSIEQTEIRAKSTFTLYDVIKDEFGLTLARYGGPGQLSYIYTRGAAASQTLITLDGVELNMVNDPTNTVDLANIMLDNIERIEIVRGPQSTLYGSEAFGGIINLFSRGGNSDKDSYFFTAEGGSYSSYRGSAGLNGAYNNLTYSLQTSRYITEGFSSAAESDGNTEKDGTKNFNLLSTVGYLFTPSLKLTFTGKYTEADTDLDQTGGKFGDDPSYIFALQETAFKTGLSYELNKDNRVTASASYIRNFRKYSFDSTFNNPASSHSSYDGNKFRTELLGDFILNDALRLTAGAETEKEEAISDYFNNGPFGIYSSTFPKKSLLTASGFLQAQAELYKNLSGSYGIRLDNQERFGNAVTFRIAQGYLIESISTKLKFTYGNAYKAPSLFYLYDPAYGNADLKPEKSSGWEAGLEHYLSSPSSHIGLTYFRTDYKELFGFDATFRAVNVNAAEAYGAELYFRGEISPVLTIKANYTWMKTADKSPGSADENKPLLRRPEHKLGLNATWQASEKALVNLQAVFTGIREDKDFSTWPATRKELSSYTLVNAAVSYRAYSFVTVFARAENLLNASYQEVLGYGHPEISFYGGIRFDI